MPVLQNFPRQAQDDSLIPQWTDDIPTSEIPDQDLDDEDNVSISLTGASTTPGKTHARPSMKDWLDDDNDDCVLLEVYNP